ncbi:MAG TPA: LuxR C-terminal-related transcriptional regulator [Thermomicrobiales bacterium]
MGSLPVPETSFVGRERELAVVVAKLTLPEVKLLVLTGPGGVGKTRLALAAAVAVGDRFRDGAAFVDLAPLSNPSQFLPELAAALGVPESDERTQRDRVIAALRRRRMLLVLDNFETVLGAAPDLAALLDACRTVTWLVTSRTRLGLPGEVNVPVEPLSLAPPAGNAAAYPDAVRLFLDRAKAANPDATLTPATLPDIEAICRRLDGLPLAIELAAVRLRAWSPAELAARLDDPLDVLTGGPGNAPARLRTMHDAVAWSYRLLPPDLQAQARRLAVFRGGFDAGAAVAVADAAFDETGRPKHPFDGEASFIINRLNLLVDHSLLRFVPVAGAHRYAMLEAVREFGWDRLAEAGELAAARRAHAEHFLAVAEQTRPLLFTRGYRQAMTTRIVDQHNFRAALAWAAETGETGVRLRLCSALWEFWYQCGFVAEGRAEVEAALAADGGTPFDRPPALSMAGFLAWLQGDNEHARRRWEESLALVEVMGSPWHVATVHNLLPLVAWRAGDTSAMRRHAGFALAVGRESGDPTMQAIALVSLAIADRLDGRLEEAAAIFDQGRRLAEQIGFLWLAAAAGFGAGEVALDRGHEAEAVAHYRDSLAITAELGDRWGIGAAVGGIACVAAMHDDAARAARLFAAADGLLASGSTFLPTLNRQRYERLKTDIRSQFGSRAFARLSATGRAWDTAAVVAEAQAFANRITGVDGGSPSATEIGVHLTPRERDVLRLVAAGHQDPAIAQILSLSPRTVSDRVGDLLRKCEQPTRTALAVYAVRHGLV